MNIAGKSQAVPTRGSQEGPRHLGGLRTVCGDQRSQVQVADEEGFRNLGTL